MVKIIEYMYESIKGNNDDRNVQHGQEPGDGG